MPLTRPVEFLAVDEVQLVEDAERGHVFTHRLLHARGSRETMLLGAATMAPLVRRLAPDARIMARDRYSALTWSGARKVSRLPRRSAVVAFSAEEVYAIAELIRRQRGGAAVVMGSLSPRTRNAQVALFQSGEVDFLVATDAIGMGLNMDVDHVAFAGLAKFDGKRRRPLHAHEIGQIAGRAGRFRNDGTFGVTAGAQAMDADTVAAVEAHRFDPVAKALWRNGALDFSSLQGLLGSLAEPAPCAELKPSEEALDERVLRQLAADEGLAGRVRDPQTLRRLWDVCQTPDFRKTTFDDHLRLARDLYGQLTGARERVADEWMAEGLQRLDRLDGGIDAISTRLAGVRTLAFISHRPDWLADAAHWRERTRTIEDRLSDALHEQLMARFVDQRTSALLRGLGARRELLAGIDAEGLVSVEGFGVGHLRGLTFSAVKGSGALEQKALRRAAEQVIGPEINRRLGALAAEPHAAFSLSPEGLILWRGSAVAIPGGQRPLAPAARLLTGLGSPVARARAEQRLSAWLGVEMRRRFAGLARLERALAGDDLRGLARGLVWRLVEAGGVVERSPIEADLRSLSRVERRALRQLGVRIGAFSLHLPSQLRRDTAPFAEALARGNDGRAWTMGLRGNVRLGETAVSALELERLAEALREAPRRDGGAVLDKAALDRLGLTSSQAETLLRGLGFVPTNGNGSDEPIAWRRRRAARDASRPRHSPFAVLGALAPASPSRSRGRKHVRRA
jgi:ATP-dependent RNA helicase SUPV3L1/SUV3